MNETIAVPADLLARLFNPMSAGEAAAQLARIGRTHGLNLYEPGVIEPHMVAACIGERASQLAGDAAVAQFRQGSGWGASHRHAYVLGYLRRHSEGGAV